MDDARLLKLEEKVAYQDKLLAELDEVVISLRRSVEDLGRRLGALEQALRNDVGAREVPNEKPPHY